MDIKSTQDVANMLIAGINPDGSLSVVASGGNADGSLNVRDAKYSPDGQASVIPLTGDSVAASASIGAGDNGTVVVTALTKGTAGNGATGGFSIEVVVAAEASQPLEASIDDGAILVTLATDENGDPDNTANTAALIEDAINGILNSGVEAAASGTGADALTAAEGPTDFTGGEDGSERVIELTPGKWNDLQFLLFGNPESFVAIRFRTVGNNRMADMTNLNYARWHSSEKPVWVDEDAELYAYVSLINQAGTAVETGVAGSMVLHSVRG